MTRAGDFMRRKYPEGMALWSHSDAAWERLKLKRSAYHGYNHHRLTANQKIGALQREAYIVEMGREPRQPETYEQQLQFSYNPRKRDHSAILSGARA